MPSSSHGRSATSTPAGEPMGSTRYCVGCALILSMIIQTIGQDPSGAVWADDPANVSRPDPSGAYGVDAEHPSRNRKVVGSNPTSGSRPQVRGPPRSSYLGLTMR